MWHVGDMLLGSPVRSRTLFYAVIIALLLLTARVIYTTPSDGTWSRRNQWPLMATESPAEKEIESPLISPEPFEGLDQTPQIKSPPASESSPAADEKAGSETESNKSGSSSGDADESNKYSSAKSHSETDSGSSDKADSKIFDHAPLDDPANDDLPCKNLPGAEDVVVIMRTGATEIQDKLPAHFDTTFRCYSDLIIFSDYEEIFMGKQVHDVLKNIDPWVKEQIEDFDIYNRVNTGGRGALFPAELSGKLSYEGSKSGKTSPGWRLDKWKFLPMMRETLNLRPDKKWYVFVESDTYLVWSNVLRYLEVLDPSQDVYYGSEVQIGDDLFAHGGSAFVMSKSSIEKAAVQYEANKDDYHDLIDIHWAGDCVLAVVLHDVKIELGWAWPMFQGGHPEKMDYAEEKGDVKIWCSPILSFHHLNDEELPRIWQFEQEWINHVAGKRKSNSKRWSGWTHDDTVLHGSDVFRGFVLPNLTDFKREWNSLSPDLVADSEGITLDQCRRQCEVDSSCLQYTHVADGCYKSKYAMLGQPWGQLSSGWLMDRVESWMKEQDYCEEFFQTWSITT